MNKPSISFIIPYYKVELPLLARAITSILRLGQKADWEVWVINDGTPGHGFPARNIGKHETDGAVPPYTTFLLFPLHHRTLVYF